MAARFRVNANANGLIKSDREILEIELGIDSARRQPGERPIQRAAKGRVLLAQGDADALAKKPALGIGAAFEAAAIVRRRAIEPYRQRQAVAEHGVDRAAAQSLVQRAGVGISLLDDFWEKRIEKGLMRRAGDDADCLAGQRRRRGVGKLGILARDEAGGRSIIRLGEVDLVARRRRRRDRGDDGVAFALQ